jgi:YD repeat-containing protein
VRALQGTTVVATASTNGTGDYALSSLTVGTYTVEASAPGYGTKRQNQVSVVAGTTTVNLSLDAIVSGPVSYIYDALGRLVATVGPTDTTTYTYDAVGNLLSISRQSSSLVSILQFTPGSGPIGATVTISGTGFSPTANENTVTFNGVAATITSATPTQLVTSVPPGATTGLVGVTSSNGSATSNTNFTVTDGSGGAPTISSFTPNLGAAGDSVTVTGTNFELTPTDNKLKFSGGSAGVSSSTATSIVGAVPQYTGSGRISVTTPTGTATSAADFYVAPPGRPASDVVFTSRSSLGGLTNVTINTAGKVGLVIFDATAGQRVTLHLTDITMGRVRVSLINPNGSMSASPINCYSYPGWAVIDPIPLPQTGTYTVVLDGYDPVTGPYSGSLNLQLHNTPPDITGPITPGGASVPVSITTPGQLARLTFNGAANQVVSVNITGSLPGSWATIYKPDGSNLTGAHNLGGANLGFMDRQVLPSAGTYTIVIDPKDANIGNFDVRLYDVVDASGTLTPGGPSEAVSIAIPGQHGSFTFDGTAGQQVSLGVTGVSMSPANNTSIVIYKPDGSTLVSDTVYSSMNLIVIDAQTLPVSGTYRVLVDPAFASTGSLNLALYNAPDVNDTIAIGEVKTITVPVVGQRAKVIFNATAGQTLGLHMTNPTMSVKFKVSQPDGSPFIGEGSAPSLVEMTNLPASGAYTILVDPQGTATGNLTLSLYDNSPITGTIVVNGPGMTITNNPAQIALLTFDGVAGQQITVRFTNNSVGGMYAQLLKPDGSMLRDAFSSASNFNISTVTLPTSGTYTISVDPQWSNAGSVTIAVTNP